jgi:dolichol-phosphate mannosyltransferase
MDAAFVRTLTALPERLRFVRGLRAWLGGNQVGVPVDRAARREGESQYSFAKLLRLAFDGIFSFSDAPLRIASIAGMAISGLAFIGAGVVIAWHFLGLLPSGAGAATIALSVLFLGGLQLLAVGILGEYVGRIFQEVKGRPVGIVAAEFGRVVEPAPSGIASDIRTNMAPAPRSEHAEASPQTR